MYLTEGRITEIDIPESIFWAKKFEYPTHQLPFSVSYEMQQIESGMKNVSMHDGEECWDDDVDVQASRNDVTAPAISHNTSIDDWDTSNGCEPSPAPSYEYLEMDVPLDKIVFVDDKAKFLQFANEIRQEVNVSFSFN